MTALLFNWMIVVISVGAMLATVGRPLISAMTLQRLSARARDALCRTRRGDGSV